MSEPDDGAGSWKEWADLYPSWVRDLCGGAAATVKILAPLRESLIESTQEPRTGYQDEDAVEAIYEMDMAIGVCRDALRRAGWRDESDA